MTIDGCELNYWPVNRGLARPRLRSERAIWLLSELGESPDKAHVERAVRIYHWRRWWAVLCLALLVMLMALVAVVTMPGLGVGLALVAGALVASLVAAFSLVVMKASGPISDGPMLEALGVAHRSVVWAHNSVTARPRPSTARHEPMRMIYGLRNAARSAQRAYLRFCGGRWAPYYPPALHDSAIKPAYALMSVEFPTSSLGTEQLQHLLSRWRTFLVDVMILVAIHRVDLLVVLRTKVYSDLPGRSGAIIGDDLKPSDEEVQFLAPLKGRHRWDFAKDFVMPSLSLMFSAVALLVSLSRA